MRKNIDSSVFAGIGLVVVLLLLIGVFRSMGPISEADESTKHPTSVILPPFYGIVRIN